MIEKFSIIIPAYNEQDTIIPTIEKLQQYLAQKSWIVELVVVNDGSDDHTGQVLKSFNNQITVVTHPYNKGYGAAIMSGVERAAHEWILLFDSDGQHTPESIESLLKKSADYDMVIGSRENGYKGPLLRQPGKLLLHKIAEYLVQQKIPDLNSGLRLAKKKLFMKYFPIYPFRFSITTTSTLAFLKDRYNVGFVPIEIQPRQGGKSQVGVHDGFKTIMLIVRIIMIFSPLRVFIPVSGIFFLLGLGSLAYDIYMTNIGDTTVLLLVVSMLLFFFGLLADQVAAIRRQLK